MIGSNTYNRLLAWRERNIPIQRFIIFLSLLVGISTALAACLLKWAIHAIQHLLTTNFTFYSENWLYLLYPIIGIILASLFVRYVVRDDISHGVTKILYAISQRKSII